MKLLLLSLATVFLFTQDRDFASFKNKMYPSVGRKITVTGKLQSAKLGLIVTFDDWGVYIHGVTDAGIDKMNSLGRLEGQTVKAVGTLRYFVSPRVRGAQIVARAPDHFYFDISEVEVTSTRALADLTYREARFRKPPLVQLYFDVILHNEEKQPRWFLLPSNLGPGMEQKGGVDGLEVLEPRGKGHVVIGHFLGTGGFYALLLPAGAEIRLQSFPISYWGEPPDLLNIEVTTATRISIGEGQSRTDARTWFGADPLSSVNANISEELNAKQVVHTYHTPDHKELPTTVNTDARITVPARIYLSRH